MMIVIFPRNGHWWAELVEDAETCELFGTTALPTPWPATASADEVMARLRQRNPGARLDYFATEADWLADVLAWGGSAALMALGGGR